MGPELYIATYSWKTKYAEAALIDNVEYDDSL